MSRNRFGLPRTPPESVQREVRKRCGFGCVICGLVFYDFEHFDPDYKDAKEHNPKGITLLCPTHNQRRARGTLSAQTVALADSNPKCKQDGFSSDFFDFGADEIKVSLGGIDFTGCQTLIRVGDVNLLAIKKPVEPGGPFLLSGKFSDSSGAVSLEILDNRFSLSNANWDIQIVGQRMKFRRSLGDVALSLRVIPPSEVIIERLDLHIDGLHLKADENNFSYSEDGKNWSVLSGSSVRGCPVGIRFE